MIPENIKSHSSSEVAVVPPSTFAFNKMLMFIGKESLPTEVSFTGSSLTRTWSMSYWFYTEGIRSGIQIGSSNGTSYIGYITSSTQVINRLLGNASFTFPNMYGALHHFLVTCEDIDGSNCNVRMYMDGVESVDGTRTGLYNPIQVDRIGGRNGTLKYGGGLTELCYKEGYVASPSDAVALYNGGAGIDSSTILASPTHHFKMDGEGTQKILKNYGSGSDGVLNDNFSLGTPNAPSMWVANDVGGTALKFDGRSNSDVSESFGTLATNNLIYSFYFRGIFNGNAGYIFNNPNTVRVWISIGTTNLTIRSGTSSQQVFTIPVRTTDTYHTFFVTCAANGDTRVYMDGVESVDGLKTQGNQQGLGTLWFGNYQYASTNWLRATLDHFTTWFDYVGTPADAVALHNGGVPVDPTTVIASPVINYDFEVTDFSQRFIEDKSGNNIHIPLATGSGNFDFADDYWVSMDTFTTSTTKPVIDRMTTPLGSFRNALDEYVKSEQAAANDNWALTDEVQAFNVDSETNAMTGWKAINPVITFGSPVHTPYQGFLLVSANTDGIYTGIKPSTAGLTNYLVDSAFFTSLSEPNALTAAGTRIMQDKSQGAYQIILPTYLQPRINSSNSTTDTLWADGAIPLEEILAHSKVVSASGGEHYYNGYISVSTGTNSALPTEIGLGYRIFNNTSFTDQTSKMFILGGGVNFDTLSHMDTVRRFADRMLIQKHIAEVNTVLARYTDLTDREVFAIGRLVARSVENGNWALLDTFWVFGLYTESNAKICLKGFIGTENEPLNHTSGKGFKFTGTQILTTNYIPSIDGVNVVQGKEFSSFIYSELSLGTGLPQYHWEITSGSPSRFSMNTSDVRTLTSQGYARTLVILPPPEKGGCVAFVRDDSVISGFTTYIDNTESSSDGRPSLGVGTSSLEFGNRTASLNAGASNAYAQSFAYGSPDILRDDLYTDQWQCVNELEIGKADTVDWDVASKTYDWSSRELSPLQLEELVTTINANCDSATTGRTLNLVGHLGITINAQAQLDDLSNNKGWTIVLV